jgi:hypothetical protein
VGEGGGWGGRRHSGFEGGWFEALEGGAGERWSAGLRRGGGWAVRSWEERRGGVFGEGSPGVCALLSLNRECQLGVWQRLGPAGDSLNYWSSREIGLGNSARPCSPPELLPEPPRPIHTAAGATAGIGVGERRGES